MRNRRMQKNMTDSQREPTTQPWTRVWAKVRPRPFHRRRAPLGLQLARWGDVSTVDAMIRNSGWALLAWAWVGLHSVQAQVELKIEVPQTQFLAGERLDTVARFSNFSGSPITLGKEPGWLRFHVEDRSGVVVNKLSEVEESGAFPLQPVERGSLRFDLEPHFKLDQPGRYRVYAVAQLPGGEEITSPAATFEIVRGNRVAEQAYGFNAPDGPERRKFILHQVNYLREVLLYVRCCDEREATTYKVTRLGRTVSYTQPQEFLDSESRWHVLHQFGRTEYGYHVFGPDGALEVRQTYVITDRRPQLRVNDTGKIAVIGGARRPSVDDFPAAPAGKIEEVAPFTPDDKPKLERKPDPEDLPKKAPKAAKTPKPAAKKP